MACTQQPVSALDELLQQRAKLMKLLTSGVQEVEQPMLGRAQYRSMDDIASALRYLDGLIAALNPGVDTLATRRARRPIHPVVTEL